MSELASPSELFWWDARYPISSRGSNLSPMGFIELIQALYRNVRPSVTVTADSLISMPSQFPHISVRVMRRTTGQDGKTPKTRTTTSGIQIQGQRFHHVIRFYVHGETNAQAEAEAYLLEHVLRDYRGALKFSGVCNFAFSDGGADFVSVQGGQVVPTVYRDYEVILEELTTVRNMPIQLVQLQTFGAFEIKTDRFDVSNAKPIPQKQELTYAPVWVSHVWQSEYYFVEGLDYIVRPYGIEWLESVPLPYAVRYYYSPQRVLELT